MRIYKNFNEAHSEVLRDITEMGIIVRPKTMQNKAIEGNRDFETLELQNYIYMVTNPRFEDLNPVQPWASNEFSERISGRYINPGNAWKLRDEVWKEFLDDNGKFCYTYSERYSDHNGLGRIIEHIKKDPDSRQLYLSVWNPWDVKNLGVKRVPCSLGYLFQVRDGKLNITYNMRSCDFITHFQNDCYLTLNLLHYVAERTGYKMGTFTHFINSLHIYRKDAQGVF